MNPSTQSTPVAIDQAGIAVAKPVEDEFLSLDGLSGIMRAAAERTLQRTLSEIEEMSRQNRWEDIVSLFSPVEEKLPELAAYGLGIELQLKVAFALGQLKRFDDAIRVLLVCIEKDPENFSAHSSLGYTAYTSLYAARNREIFLSGNARHDCLELSHRHFKKAQALRPDGVTSFYREGMLFKQIEGKADAAVPFFEKAVSNWEGLGGEEKARRHQERKNFIKALYNLVRNPAFTFQGRNRRPPLDPVNALLSFVYTMLTNEVLSSIKSAGLDPYLGSLHDVSYGRPSLACDLVEEYRCFLGDRLILGLINRKALTPDDFVYRNPTPAEFVDEEEMVEKRPVEMKPAVSRTFIAAYEEMMKRSIIYPPLGKKLTYRWLILQQVRAFGEYLEDPQKVYRPFLWEE